MLSLDGEHVRKKNYREFSITKIVIHSKTKHFQKQPQLFSEIPHQKLQKKIKIPVRPMFIAGAPYKIRQSHFV
jgi:hypothetical protein